MMSKDYKGLSESCLEFAQDLKTPEIKQEAALMGIGYGLLALVNQLEEAHKYQMWKNGDYCDDPYIDPSQG